MAATGLLELGNFLEVLRVTVRMAQLRVGYLVGDGEKILPQLSDVPGGGCGWSKFGVEVDCGGWWWGAGGSLWC